MGWRTSDDVEEPPIPETRDFYKSEFNCYVTVGRKVTAKHTYTKRKSISNSLLICGLLIGAMGHGNIE